MEEKIRKSLEARFPPKLVKKRRGSFGKTVSYIEGNAVIARLNDCFSSAWDFRIVTHETLETAEVLVLGRLTAMGVTKAAFGRGMPAVSKETGELLSAADAFKAASTDALKKCATLLGVASYLYCDKPEETQESHEPQQPNEPLEPQESQRRNSSAKPQPRQLNGNRLTQKQLSAIWSMARRLNLSADQIRDRTYDVFDAAPEQLSKVEASSFISELASEIDSQRGAA